MEKRNKHIRQYCRSHSTSKLTGYIIGRSRPKFFYCPVYKAASSTVIATLRNTFSNSKQFTDEINTAAAERMKYISQNLIPKETYLKNPQKYDSYTKFVIVRNPYDRLVSSYKDKFEKLAKRNINNPKMTSKMIEESV